MVHLSTQSPHSKCHAFGAYQLLSWKWKLLRCLRQRCGSMLCTDARTAKVSCAPAFVSPSQHSPDPQGFGKTLQRQLPCSYACGCSSFLPASHLLDFRRERLQEVAQHLWLVKDSGLGLVVLQAADGGLLEGGCNRFWRGHDADDSGSGCRSLKGGCGCPGNAEKVELVFFPLKMPGLAPGNQPTWESPAACRHLLPCPCNGVQTSYFTLLTGSATDWARQELPR